MDFEAAMQAVRHSNSDTVDIPEHWGQGRATFGGMVAAAMYERIALQVAPDRPLRSMMVSFVAPVVAGRLGIVVNILRQGKGATQIQATAYQDEQTCAVVLASFGGGRESSVHVAAAGAPDIRLPGEVQPFPFIPGLTPDFTQHFDYRYTVGQMPFMGSDLAEIGGWIALRAARETPASVAEILALLDAWPPAVFSMLKQPASGSTLTWNISFIDPAPTCRADDWWQYQAAIQHSAGGYSHIDARLWDKHGNPTVISRQTVSVFG